MRACGAQQLSGGRVDEPQADRAAARGRDETAEGCAVSQDATRRVNALWQRSRAWAHRQGGRLVVPQTRDEMLAY